MKYGAHLYVRLEFGAEQLGRDSSIIADDNVSRGDERSTESNS
jgi:hypothetical protein